MSSKRREGHFSLAQHVICDGHKSAAFHGSVDESFPFDFWQKEGLWTATATREREGEGEGGE